MPETRRIMTTHCDNSIKPDNASYSKILFQRGGGGSKSFYATTNTQKEIIIDVTSYNFKDTSYSITKSDTANLSSLISNLLNNKTSLS